MHKSYQLSHCDLLGTLVHTYIYTLVVWFGLVWFGLVVFCDISTLIFIIKGFWMKTIVRKTLMIKIIKFRLRNLDNQPLFVI